MYMRDAMHPIDSGVIISFLKAIIRKFRECVELPLGIAGEAAKNLKEADEKTAKPAEKANLSKRAYPA